MKKVNDVAVSSVTGFVFFNLYLYKYKNVYVTQSLAKIFICHLFPKPGCERSYPAWSEREQLS